MEKTPSSPGLKFLGKKYAQSLAEPYELPIWNLSF